MEPGAAEEVAQAPKAWSVGRLIRVSRTRVAQAALVTALLILVMVAVASQLATTQLAASLEREGHSYRLLARVKEVEAQLKSAESAHRGYLATGDAVFQPEYESGVSSLRAALQELAGLTAEDADQQQRLQLLRDAVEERLASWREAQAMAGMGEALRAMAVARTAEGRELRDRIDRLLRAMAAGETDLLERRQRVVRRLLRWGQIMGGAGVVLSIVLVLGATLATSRGMRKRMETERELAESEARLRELLDTAGDLTESSSAAGRILYVNRAWLETLGWRESEVIGRSYDEFVAPELRDHARAVFARLITSEAPVTVETVLMRKDGGRVHVGGTSSMRFENGRPIATRTILRDVTKQREIDRRRDELASVVSRELRTPLTSVRGSLGLLASGQLGPLTERGLRMLEVAISNTDRLIQLSEDMLDTERLQLGTASLVRRPMDLEALATEVEEVVRPLADQAGVKLIVSVPPATLIADPDGMFQMMMNLLGNAIRFSPPGAAVLLSGLESEEHVHLRVVDHGPGIPADRLGAVFSRAHQRDVPDLEDRSTSGMGLDVVRGVVEQHAGVIWAETEGARTTFHVVLSKGQPEAATAEAEAPARADAASAAADVSRTTLAKAILLIEDEEDLRLVARASLELARGWDVYEASSGRAGIQSAVELRPDAILLDVMMPDMDAPTTVEALRANPATRDIPLILLTAAAGDGARFEGLGVRGTITKPFNPLELADEIVRVLGWDDEEPGRTRS